MLGSERRVAITGLGLVTPLGDSPDRVWTSLIEGRGMVRPIEAFRVAGLPSDAGAESDASMGRTAEAAWRQVTEERGMGTFLYSPCFRGWALPQPHHSNQEAGRERRPDDQSDQATAASE